MRNSLKISIAVLGIISIMGWVLYSYIFSSNTIIDAIEEVAIEDYEQAYKVINTYSIGDKTICIFESRYSGFGISTLVNDGTEEKTRYKQIEYQHIPFVLIKDDIPNYYKLYEDNCTKIICGIIKEPIKDIYINDDKVSVFSYYCEDMHETIGCWVYSCNQNEKVEISYKR